MNCEKFSNMAVSQVLISMRIRELFKSYPLTEIAVIPIFICDQNHLHAISRKSNKNIKLFELKYEKLFSQIIITEMSDIIYQDFLNLWTNAINEKPFISLEYILSHSLSSSDPVSDIHLVPMENETALYYRIYGKMQFIGFISSELCELWVRQMKARTKLDVFRKKQAQSGATNFFFEAQQIFIRISFHPSFKGEKT
jgi:type II secretory ATPase GspE/PulE/Tfp pilus assembly ATPase PilB-like protein